MNNANSRVDTSSYSNCQAVVSQSVHLDWTLDFDREIIYGKAVHSMKVLVGGTSTVDFDTSKLHIKSATIDGTSVKFAYVGEQNHLGRKLSVEIPQALR
jgi:leukotriene-A4 hydrolase